MNPTAFDFDSPKQFVTKLQRMSFMQEGRAMGEGRFFNARSDEKMANEVRSKWRVEHPAPFCPQPPFPLTRTPNSDAKHS